MGNKGTKWTRRDAGHSAAQSSSPTSLSLASSPSRVLRADASNYFVDIVSDISRQVQRHRRSAQGRYLCKQFPRICGRIRNQLPAVGAAVGEFGAHAPLVGVVFSVLKATGEHFAAVRGTYDAYDKMKIAMSFPPPD